MGANPLVDDVFFERAIPNMQVDALRWQVWNLACSFPGGRSETFAFRRTASARI
jgi:hypothetical protein